MFPHKPPLPRTRSTTPPANPSRLVAGAAATTARQAASAAPLRARRSQDRQPCSGRLRASAARIKLSDGHPAERHRRENRQSAPGSPACQASRPSSRQSGKNQHASVIPNVPRPVALSQASARPSRSHSDAAELRRSRGPPRNHRPARPGARRRSGKARASGCSPSTNAPASTHPGRPPRPPESDRSRTATAPASVEPRSGLRLVEDFCTHTQKDRPSRPLPSDFLTATAPTRGTFAAVWDDTRPAGSSPIRHRNHLTISHYGQSTGAAPGRGRRVVVGNFK